MYITLTPRRSPENSRGSFWCQDVHQNVPFSFYHKGIVEKCPLFGLTPMALSDCSTSKACPSPELHTNISRGPWNPTGTSNGFIHSQFSLTPRIKYAALELSTSVNNDHTSSFKPEHWVTCISSHLWEHSHWVVHLWFLPPSQLQTLPHVFTYQCLCSGTHHPVCLLLQALP